jgi:hypothetical protein
LRLPGSIVMMSEYSILEDPRRTPDLRKDGRHEETRTPDLYRVKVAL